MGQERTPSSVEADPWGHFTWVMVYFTLTAVCSQQGELRGAGAPGLGKRWPPSCLQRPCQARPRPARIQPRLPPVGHGLARGGVRLARRPHPEPDEQALAAHHPRRVQQEEGAPPGPRSSGGACGRGRGRGCTLGLAHPLRGGARHWQQASPSHRCPARGRPAPVERLRLGHLAERSPGLQGCSPRSLLGPAAARATVSSGTSRQSECQGL